MRILLDECVPWPMHKLLAGHECTTAQKRGWPPELLHLLLAGLTDLLPWIKRWHSGPNPDYGMGRGDCFAGFLEGECRKNGTTVTALAERRFRL